MELKYGAELGQYPNCPPKTAKPMVRRAFRFVHENLDDKRNFLPVIKLDPTRVFRPHVLCDTLALSMFASKETAEKRFAALKLRNRNIHKTLGSHLAEGSLTEGDGVSTPDSDDGHFSLYEARDVTWEGRFTIIGDLRGSC